MPREMMRELIAANLPSGALHATSDGSNKKVESQKAKSPADFLSAAMQGQARNAQDPRVLGRAQDMLLEHALGTRVTDLGSLIPDSIHPMQASSPTTATASADPGSVDGYQAGFPVGDLDGDGLGDVIEIRIGWSTVTYELVELNMSHVSGVTGTKKWTRSLLEAFDLFIYPVDDMNGDGGRDLMLAEMRLDSSDFVGECNIIICAGAADYSYRWVISPLSGSTGSEIWTKSYDGEAHFAFEDTWALVAGQVAERFTFTNGVVFPQAVARPGGSDAVINAFDFEGIFGFQYAFALVAGAFAAELLILVETDAAVADGATGDVLMRRSQEKQLGGAWLSPAGTTVGGASEDLLWRNREEVAPAFACAFTLLLGTCLAPARMSLSLEMIDGDTLARAWHTRIDGPTQEWAGVWPSRADVDGDNAEDLMFFRYGPGLEQGFLSGGDGSVLWSIESEGWIDILGPVGGAPGDDVIRFDFAWTSGGYTIDLVRLDGATGAELFRTTQTATSFGESGADVWVYVFGDADADGARDLGIIIDGWGTTNTLTNLVESGATGASIYSKESADSFIFPIGDLDASGTVDAISFDVEYLQYKTNIVSSGIAMPTGVQQWTRTDTFLQYAYLSVRRSSDMFGNGGTDLIYNQEQGRDDIWESRYLGIDGRNGVTRWTAGDTFTVPSEPTGSIAGTVRNTSGQGLSGVCVSIWHYGHIHQSTTTGVDGTYALTAIEDGTHVLQFDDCGAGTLETQWYNAKSDPWMADPVQIVNGGLVSGIDAVMKAGPDPSNLTLMREQERSYIGVGGDAMVSGPLPNGILNDCSTDGISHGGTCFEVSAEDGAITFDIEDASGSAISASYSFSSDRNLPFPTNIAYGEFCGQSGRIIVPRGAVLVWVFTKTLDSALSCDTPAAATAGTVKASFFG